MSQSEQLDSIKRFAESVQTAQQHHEMLCRMSGKDCKDCPLTWDSICDQIMTLVASVNEVLTQVEQYAATEED